MPKDQGKTKKEQIILGIDPGSVVMGYALIQVSGQKLTLIQLGVIRLTILESHYERIKKIEERVSAIIEEYKPDEVAFEAPFFGKNVQSMLKLGRAQGAAMVAALRHDLDVFEYEPRKVKKSVTGKGAASKEQVAGFLSTLLTIDTKSIPLDATDALGVAVCHHYNSGKAAQANSKDWSAFVKQNPGRLKG